MASEQDAPDVQGAKQSTDTIDGVPVLLTDTSDGGPGDVYFNIGTANDNAVEITVVGRYQPSDLEPVAQSIIDQWAVANEPTSGAMGVHPSG